MTGEKYGRLYFAVAKSKSFLATWLLFLSVCLVRIVVGISVV